MTDVSSSKPRIPGLIARDLGIKIVSGRILPGAVLDGEVVASGRRKVSRSAYREAVRVLAAKGLVSSRTKTGTQVNAQTDWHLLDPDVLAWMFQHEPDANLLVGLFELRMIVEPQTASLAAERRNASHIERMAVSLERMARHSLSSPEGVRADQQFHAALLEASGNPFLCSLTSGISAAVAWTDVFKQRVEPLQRDPIPDHRKVFEAVSAGDGKTAYRRMNELVELAFHDTINAPRQAAAMTPNVKRADRRDARRARA